MKIYTKTGDKGTSSNYLNERLPKNDPLFNLLGDLDELNAYLGLIESLIPKSLKSESLSISIQKIQTILMDISSHIATRPSKSIVSSSNKIKKTEFYDDDIVINLEKNIDNLDKELPPLKNFVLPSGHPLVCQIHISRTIARRTERKLYDLIDCNYNDVINRYMNRLSDYLFTLARWFVLKLECKEIIYKPFS
jgi:cob(I)alamin adenosyltransferase